MKKLTKKQLKDLGPLEKVVTLDFKTGKTKFHMSKKRYEELMGPIKEK